MDAGINNVIYMESHSGPKIANGTRGKTIVGGTIDRDSTVHKGINQMHQLFHLKTAIKMKQNHLLTKFRLH
jgi:hypothetical protein